MAVGVEFLGTFEVYVVNEEIVLLTPEQRSTITKMYTFESKIDAIKALRSMKHGLSLRDSKDLVEHLNP